MAWLQLLFWQVYQTLMNYINNGGNNPAYITQLNNLLYDLTYGNPGWTIETTTTGETGTNADTGETQINIRQIGSSSWVGIGSASQSHSQSVMDAMLEEAGASEFIRGRGPENVPPEVWKWAVAEDVNTGNTYGDPKHKSADWREDLLVQSYYGNPILHRAIDDNTNDWLYTVEHGAFLVH
jgi:hypothetical protein